MPNLHINLRDAQWEALKEAAEDVGMPLSTWVRRIALAAAGADRDIIEQIGRARGEVGTMRVQRGKND